MNRKLIYLFICTLFAFCSCSDDEKIDYTAPGILAGEWWVTYYQETAPGKWEVIGNYKNLPLYTYNSAANKADELFVDDQGEFWDFKVKAFANPGALSFGSDAELANLSYEDCNVVITEGKVMFNAAKSKTGIVTDSICFKVKFSDDPDQLVYKVEGHKRTGWTDDEY